MSDVFFTHVGFEETESEDVGDTLGDFVGKEGDFFGDGDSGRREYLADATEEVIEVAGSAVVAGADELTIAGAETIRFSIGAGFVGFEHAGTIATLIDDRTVLEIVVTETVSGVGGGTELAGVDDARGWGVGVGGETSADAVRGRVVVPDVRIDLRETKSSFPGGSNATSADIDGI